MNEYKSFEELNRELQLLNLPIISLEKYNQHLDTNHNFNDCMICGIRDCPFSEPLHYDDDDCPSCYLAYIRNTHNDGA